MSGFGSLQNSNNNDDCLDLPSKRIYVLVFFAVSDLGHEYEIFERNELGCSSWCCLSVGSPIDIKYGPARTRGEIVKVSDNLRFLKKNFRKLVKMHQESLKNGEPKIIPKKEYILQSRNYIESMNITPNYHIPKEELGEDYIKPKGDASITDDKGTQTDQLSESLDSEIVDLEKKYEEIRNKYQRIYTLVLDLKSNMEKSLSKVNNFRRDANEDTTYNSSLEEDKENAENFSKMIQIGSKGTKISKQVYDIINWSSYTAATRKLLVTLFPREVLATHSLTGKPSPAFLTSDKEAKARLDPNTVSDIVEVVSKKSKVSESLVRNAITTKCADENKLYKKRLQRSNDEDDDVNGKRKRDH